MKLIIYTREDGGLSVVTPAFGWDLDTVMNKDVPESVRGTARIVDATELPTDRAPAVRYAWKDTGTKIVVDGARRAEFERNRKPTPAEEIADLRAQIEELRRGANTPRG